MKRSIPLLAVALLACGSMVGCTACQGTNDYCGPLPDEPCDFFYRRNSILGGDLQSRDPEAEQQRNAADQENLPTPAPEQGGEMPGAPAPEPMPPEGDLPSEMELPPDSDEPAGAEAMPSEGELRPGASLRPYAADPYAYHPPKRPRGLLTSLFGRR